MAKVKIIGAGAWGTTMAKVLVDAGHQVSIWAHDPEIAEQINQQHQNIKYLPGIELDDSICASTELQDIGENQFVFMMVASDYYQNTTSMIRDHLKKGQILVSATKGLTSDGQPLSEVLDKELPEDIPYVIFSGPNIASEIASGSPAAAVAAGTDQDSVGKVQDLFEDSLLRVYSSEDVIGVELGGTLKNIIAIAAGIIDGLDLGNNSKAAVMTRGVVEITRLAMELGAKEQTLYGLSGMGDLITTCSSEKSRNHFVGENLAKGKKIEQILEEMVAVAEGVLTTRYAYQLARKKGLEMPITEQIYNVLFQGYSVQEAMNNLMSRRQKEEDYS